MFSWFSGIIETLHKLGFHWLFVLPFVMAFLIALGTYFDTRFLSYLISGVLFTFPFWGPVLFAPLWWHSWRMYSRSDYLSQQKLTVMELQVPNTLEKTPKAMEMLFAGLHVTHAWAELWQLTWRKGGLQPIWSFELHSYEGQVRMYATMWSQFQDFFEAQLYAQYPSIEARVVTDYMSGLEYDKTTMEAYGIEHRKSKSEALPIRTYVDYVLEKPHTKIEQRVDPLSSLFERFSTMGEGEQVMWQLVFTMDKQKTPIKWTWIPFGGNKWEAVANKIIDKLYMDTALALIDPDTGAKTPGMSQLTPGEIERVKALERNIEKHRFQVGSRVIYLTKRGKHRPRIRSANFVHLFRQFDSDNLNKFTTGEYWHQPLDYPWQDYKKMRREYYSKKIIKAYRQRSFFYHPYPHKHTSLTTEELATIYHFPSQDCRAPGLMRIQSSKSRAPSNLPI